MGGETRCVEAEDFASMGRTAEKTGLDHETLAAHFEADGLILDLGAPSESLPFDRPQSREPETRTRR